MSAQKSTITSMTVLGILALTISTAIIIHEAEKMFISKPYTTNLAIENIAIQVQQLRNETTQIKAMIQSLDTCENKVDTIYIPVPCKYIN